MKISPAAFDKLPTEEFSALRAPYPSDKKFAAAIGVASWRVHEYRKKHKIPALVQRARAEPVISGANYHPERPMTEEEIAGLYGDRIFEDDPRPLANGAL